MFLTNGTAAGTQAIFLEGAALNPLGATPGFTPYNGGLMFSAFYDTSAGQQLWFYTDISAAIAQTKGEDIFTIYPNPCSSYYTLSGFKTGKSYTINLFDITGRAIQQQQIEASGTALQFLTPGIDAGIYLVEVRSGGETSTLRLVKSGR